MKKNLINGFSLAEVLISVGIISVIATMGFNISKKNLDRAYDKYVFTGASALALAIEDAHKQDRANNSQELIGHFANLMDIIPDPMNPNSLTAPNGIEYLIEKEGEFDATPVFRIDMTIPNKLSADRDRDRDRYSFYHVKIDNYPTLFLTGTTSSGTDFADRSDLIKYYIDSNENINVPVQYWSFREAACSLLRVSQNINLSNPVNPENENLELLNCENLDLEPQEGILRMARP